MIEIIKKDGQLLLQYSPDFGSEDWVERELTESDSVKIAKVFTFTSDDLFVDTNSSETDDEDFYFDDGESVSTFILGVSEGEYFRIKAEILGIKHDLLLSKELSISGKTFTAHRGISIFSKIDDLVDEQIVIGGNKENAVPIADFEALLKKFPNTTELNHYARSRISLILKDYLGSMSDAQKQLDNYLKKKSAIKPSIEAPLLYEQEVQKYVYIRDRIMEMLRDADAHSESEWQEEMLKFILLIFPKYIAVLKNVGIKDYYSDSKRITDRYIDLALVDANGNLDVIEIKKPFESAILSSSKYRDNFTPKKELSGGIMQAEKYLFHLNKWGRTGEKKISEKFASQLPTGMQIQITNPKAIIILGRSKAFHKDQSFDFEIIKRKYANILDIITYDDLLNRLDNIIEKFSSLAKAAS